jgi:hypothetical protein
MKGISHCDLRCSNVLVALHDSVADDIDRVTAAVPWWMAAIACVRPTRDRVRREVFLSLDPPGAQLKGHGTSHGG